jgi:hypothetical protein
MAAPPVAGRRWRCSCSTLKNSTVRTTELNSFHGWICPKTPASFPFLYLQLSAYTCPGPIIVCKTTQLLSEQAPPILTHRVLCCLPRSHLLNESRLCAIHRVLRCLPRSNRLSSLRDNESLRRRKRVRNHWTAKLLRPQYPQGNAPR